MNIGKDTVVPNGLIVIPELVGFVINTVMNYNDFRSHVDVSDVRIANRVWSAGRLIQRV